MVQSTVAMPSFNTHDMYAASVWTLVSPGVSGSALEVVADDAAIIANKATAPQLRATGGNFIAVQPNAAVNNG